MGRTTELSWNLAIFSMSSISSFSASLKAALRAGRCLELASVTSYTSWFSFIQVIIYVIMLSNQFKQEIFQKNVKYAALKLWLPTHRVTLQVLLMIVYKQNLMLSKYLQRSVTGLIKSCSLQHLNQFKFGFVVGDPYHQPIRVSTIDLLREKTQSNPSSVALNSYSQDVTLTYEQLYERAGQLATGLIKKFDLKPKDRIGIYAYNKFEWVVVQMAAAMADLILVNINPAYQSDQLAYTIDKVGLSVLFMNDRFRHLDYLKIVKAILPQMEHSNPFNLRSSKFPTLKGIVRFNSTSDIINGFVNYTDISETANLGLFPSKISTDDPANIQFTSGTTGRPKAATLSHYNILNNAYLIGQKCKYTEKDNIAVAVPFYHCFGMIMGTLGAYTRGGSITVVTEGFDPRKTLEAVSKYRCTSLYGVPTMFIEYLRQYQENPQDFNIESLRTGIIAGALCSEALMTKIIHDLKLRDITNCYGMTETSPVSFQTCPSDPFQKKTTTVGKILPGLEAKIVNASGEQCKPGQPGEFVVRGWSVMLNYWGDDNATKNSIQDGWMKSGDMGVIDEEGYLSIVGRLKDMIIRGGENIYPKEIEEFLVRMEGIQDAQVVAVSDDKYGEEVAAVIKVKSLQSNALTKEQIFQFCKDKIAFYKIPKYIKFVTQYPLTVSGKVQKYIIRNELEQEKQSGLINSYRVK